MIFRRVVAGFALALSIFGVVYGQGAPGIATGGTPGVAGCGAEVSGGQTGGAGVAGGCGPQMSPQSTAVPQTIGGVAIGTVGSGAYAGFTMVGGEDFSASLSSLLAQPSNPAGKVAHNFSERDRRLTSTTSVFALADQYWTGWQDANDGVPVSSFSDVLTQSASVLSLKTRQASTAEKLLMGVRDNTAAAITYVNGGDANGVNSKRPLVSAEVTLAQDFAYTGNRIVEARWRYTPGPTLGGAGNPAQALWELNIRGGSEAGDNAGAGWNDEMDWEEAHISTGNGTTRYASASSSSGNATPLFNGTWQITRLTVSDTTIKVDTVSDTTGNVLGTVTLTNSATNNAALWYAMFGSFATTASFNENNWTGNSATMDVDYIRVWTPANSVVTPQVANETVVLPFGGTGSLVLASQTTLWGQTVNSETIVPMYAYDSNGPGRATDQTSPLQTRDTLPTGVTWNSGTRTLSFASTFTTQAGFVNLLVYPQKTSVGFVRPHIVSVIVKPKVSLTPATATAGSAYSWTVARGSPRNWDNGNLPLGTGDGLSVVSKPSWLSYNSGTKTFTGTAPNPLNSPDDQITFRCTNALGYTTDYTATIPQGWQPSALTGLVYAWDTTDATNTPDDGSGKVASMFHIYDNTKKLGRTTQANRPSIITNGGANGTSRAVSFASASGNVLDTAEGAGLTALAQLLNGSNVQTANAYIAFAAKENSTTPTNRFLYLTDTASSMFLGWRTTSTTRGISYQSFGNGTVAVTDATPDTSWHVHEIVKSGSTLTLRIDGVQIATASIAQTAAMTASEFLLGGFYSASTRTAAFDGAFGPGVVTSTVPSTADQLSTRQWIANKMGITTSWLLERDLNPANDNSPAFMTKAA
jgi:hypothetical protein